MEQSLYIESSSPPLAYMFDSSTQTGLWQPFAMVALVGEMGSKVVISSLVLSDIPSSCAPGPPDLLKFPATRRTIYPSLCTWGSLDVHGRLSPVVPSVVVEERRFECLALKALLD